MALYRINQRNALFRGFVGDFVSAAPDPLLDAAVKSGVLSRMDTELPVLAEEEWDVPEESGGDSADEPDLPKRKRRK